MLATAWWTGQCGSAHLDPVASGWVAWDSIIPPRPNPCSRSQHPKHRGPTMGHPSRLAPRPTSQHAGGAECRRIGGSMHVGARRLRGSIPLLLLVVTLPNASRSSADELWEAQGIPLYAPTGDQLQPAILSDGVGGFISAWEDGRSATSHDVYAQRLDADGNPLWGQNGVAV